ncbi:MAG: ribonuclease M5 [Bacilli bacterium]|nr:ribonuclease M5 [Bacilli bacterium]MBN2696268.1 ribonuclease M5 [Bacilli bacterium]
MKTDSIQEVIVVEGVHDRQKLESIYPGIECIVTGGSEISEATLKLIEIANTSRGVILFLDPDFPGRKITNTILERVPECKIAFMPSSEAKSKNGRKVGVEHANKESIEKVLANVFTLRDDIADTITLEDLRIRGLLGDKHSALKRNEVSSKLGIPPANGKTFVKLLNMLSIDIHTLDEVLK